MSTVKADELESLIATAYKHPDPHQIQRACDEQDKVREELRLKCGDLQIAVELIREVRE